MLFSQDALGCKFCKLYGLYSYFFKRASAESPPQWMNRGAARNINRVVVPTHLTVAATMTDREDDE
jgi:hypothetical protein